VKLVEHDGELYILARSDGRRDKEQAIIARQLGWLVSDSKDGRSPRVGKMT
jgi:Uma2 family endonuclease